MSKLQTIRNAVVRPYVLSCALSHDAAAVLVAFSTTVRDLGLTLDQELNLSEHVNLIT